MRDGATDVSYRSSGGLVLFGVWICFVMAGTVFFASNAVTQREPLSILFAMALISVLLARVYRMSVLLKVTRDGRLVFRSLLRVRQYDMDELRVVRHGTGYDMFGCMVFEFDTDSEPLAAVATRDWRTLLGRISELNPSVTIVNGA